MNTKAAFTFPAKVAVFSTAKRSRVCVKKGTEKGLTRTHKPEQSGTAGNGSCCCQDFTPFLCAFLKAGSAVLQSLSITQEKKITHRKSLA